MDKPTMTLSDFSIGTESELTLSESVQKGGGSFFWNIFGCSENDKKVLIAAKQKDYGVVVFMIEHKMMTNFGARDSDGCTVLHYLTRDRLVHRGNNKAIKKVLQCSNIKSFINIQDNNGNTPLLVAVKTGHYDLADTYIASGADKSIRNNDGLYVGTEDCDSGASNASITVTPVFIEARTSSDMSQNTLKQIVQALTQKDQGFASLTETQGMPALPLNLSPMSQGKPNGSVTTFSPHGASPTTDDFIEQLLMKDRTVSLQQGGNEGKLSENTEMMYEKVMNEYVNSKVSGKNGMDEQESNFLVKMFGLDKLGFGGMSGGGTRTVATGQRRLNLNEGKVVNDNSRKTEYKSELARLVNKQTDEIHARVVKKIAEILKVDDKVARNYKAALWRKVSDDHPELKTRLDKAVEMEKMVTKDILKKIDIKKITADIKAHLDTKKEEFEKRSSESEQKTFKKKSDASPSISDTSPEQVSVPEDGFSPTSVSERYTGNNEPYARSLSDTSEGSIGHHIILSPTSMSSIH